MEPQNTLRCLARRAAAALAVLVLLGAAYGQLYHYTEAQKNEQLRQLWKKRAEALEYAKHTNDFGPVREVDKMITHVRNAPLKNQGESRVSAISSTSEFQHVAETSRLYHEMLTRIGANAQVIRERAEAQMAFDNQQIGRSREIGAARIRSAGEGAMAALEAIDREEEGLNRPAEPSVSSRADIEEAEKALRADTSALGDAFGELAEIGARTIDGDTRLPTIPSAEMINVMEDPARFRPYPSESLLPPARNHRQFLEGRDLNSLPDEKATENMPDEMQAQDAGLGALSAGWTGVTDGLERIGALGSHSANAFKIYIRSWNDTFDLMGYLEREINGVMANGGADSTGVEDRVGERLRRFEWKKRKDARDAVRGK